MYKRQTIPIGPVRLGLAGASLRTDGEPVRNAAGQPMGGNARGSFTRDAYTFAARLDTRRGAATLRVATDDRAYGSVRHYSASPLDTAFSTAKTTWAQAAYRGDLSARATLEASAGLRLHASTYEFNRRTPQNAHDNTQASALVAVRYAAAPGVTASAGATLSLIHI